MGTEIIEKVRAAIDDAVNELRTSKFWTDRRDAADALTEGGVSAATNLQQMCADSDPDVSAACRRCIDRLRTAFDIGPVRYAEPPQSAVQQPVRATLDEMVREVGGRSGRAARPSEDGFEIACKTSSGRQQKVYVRPGRTDSAGMSIVQVFSRCAPADERTFRWALETNCKLRLGALAVTTSGGHDTFVLMNTHLEDGLSAAELEADLSYIAETADWIEQQLTSSDVH